jgi:hypothetical protein
MTKLLSHSELLEFKHITGNIPSAMFDRYVLEAQELDLRPLLGIDLYIALVEDFEASPSLATYSDLWNGSTYDILTKKFKHEGLIPVLAYYTYARYIQNSGVNSTPYGLVEKKNDFSQPTSEKTIARKISQAQSGAKAYWERTRKYILDHPEIFETLYNCQGNYTTGQGIKIRAVGGNSSHRIITKINKRISE